MDDLVAALRHGDRALVLAQRLLEQITHAPEIEQDMALANLALDLLGQARALYSRAGEIEGAGHDEDHFAYQREPDEFTNPLLVEQPAPDFAHVVVRQYLHDEYALRFWQARAGTAGWDVAGKAVKETTYHLRYSRGWMVRLGDGTDESRARMQAALDTLWPYTAELFGDDDEPLSAPWLAAVDATLAETTLTRPALRPVSGEHEHLPAILDELQSVARAHPGATW
jgi:ring-1,2-phenylacetyl-CoA epoxidase subunit PaaC